MAGIRLGGHGLPVGSDDPFAFARAHRAFGYSAAYVPVSLIGADAQTLASWEKAFTEQDVTLAEVGIWRNLIDPDPVTPYSKYDPPPPSSDASIRASATACEGVRS